MMAANDESKEAPSNELRCDYLVVGAGAAGMAFVDTLLTEDPTCRVVLVDRRAKAGGHWVDSYPFVRLHQPSHYYGVNSLPLGKARISRQDGVSQHGIQFLDQQVVGPTHVRLLREACLVRWHLGHVCARG